MLRMSEFWKTTKIFLLTQMGKVLLRAHVKSGSRFESIAHVDSIKFPFIMLTDIDRANY